MNKYMDRDNTIKFISETNKNELYQYVDKNIDDKILRTFLTLWDERNYWKYKPIVYYVDDKIAGFIAYTINEKHTGKLKVYYVYVSEGLRGEGIGKQLLELCYSIAKSNKVNLLFVSEENSDGYKVFQHRFNYTKKLNEFNTYDYIFDIPTINDKLFTR